MKKPAKRPETTDLARREPEHAVEIRGPSRPLGELAPVGLQGLVDDTGVAERSVQRWVAEGLLPAPVVAQHPRGRGRQGMWDGSVRRLCQELTVRRGRGRERLPLWPFRLRAWLPVGHEESVDHHAALATVDAMKKMQFAVEIFTLYRQRVGPTGGGPRFPAQDQQGALLRVCAAYVLAGLEPVLVVGARRVTVAPAALLAMLLTDGELSGAWVVIALGGPLAVLGIVRSDAARSRDTTVGVRRRRDCGRPTYEITRDGVALDVELRQDVAIDVELHQDVEDDWWYGCREEDPGW